ncbi:MAG: Pyrimidine-nucleoside phosphorylase [candidate division BRC1 bacterium ADurb.BinA364]|nr:MAG: Pyrimidine-nucleoside phosphorylase [candidate division BRC1 bacterium ADurb.BinA364]
MISGRGLGHTGGTLDKLESIPGFSTRLPQRRFLAQLGRIGVFMAGQSERLAPADRRLYALRDVTATVESIPLIASSILSKKSAAGIKSLAMDVKVGSGAFMPTAAKSRELARALVSLGATLGLRVAAYLTDMSQPLGRAVGNALEIRESVAALQGEGPEDLMALVFEFGACMLRMAGAVKTIEDGRETLRRKIASGEAFERFLALIEAQGGDPRAVERPSALPVAPKRLEVLADRSGYLAAIDTRAVGLAACFLGAGRRTLADSIDPGVGFMMEKKLGQAIGKGDAIVSIHARRTADAEAAAERLKPAIRIAAAPPAPRALIRPLRETRAADAGA